PARRQPDADHPGARRAVRRRRPPDHPSIESTQEAPLCPEKDGGAGVSVRVERLQAARTRATGASTIGTVGIGLGLLALFLALPPVKLRTAPLPVAIGIFAVAAGIWAYTRGERRLGGGAVLRRAAGVRIPPFSP